MTIPNLGFGTAPILGRMAKRPSLRALDRAYQQGVRHFDTARSYGWGEAEGVLGGYLKRHPRESFTLVSKCGIVPARRSPLLSVAKAGARQLMRLIPASRRAVQRVAGASQFRPAHTYDVKLLQGSFETSLRELQVDYLDVLLLHNYAPARPGLDAVMAWLQALRRAGRIRRFGVSIEGSLHEGIGYLADQGLLGDCVLQVPLSEELFRLPEAWKKQPFFVHSPFRYMQQQQELDLPRLLVALERACRCEAVICSMFSPAHIEANARAHRAVSAGADARP